MPLWSRDGGADRGVLAADVVGGVGLGVEGVVVGEAAAEEDQDHRLGPPAARLPRAPRPRPRFSPQQGGQRKPGETQRPDAEEVAAGGAVAGAGRASGEQDVEHVV